MRKIFTCLLVATFVFVSLAMATGPKSKPLSLNAKVKKPKVIRGDEEFATIHTATKLSGGNRTGAIGPGKLLMTSTYDIGSGGGSLTNLVDYGDGTLAFARMGATTPAPATADRASFFSFFDGTQWTQAFKVETVRRGWTALGALSDGQNVIVTHVANEVNVDAQKGLGIFTSSITGYRTATRSIWPRLAVDGKNNIIISTTLDGTGFGVSNLKEVSISRDGGTTWTHQALIPDTSSRKPDFFQDDNAIDTFGDNVAISASEVEGDVHLWTSADNGATWTYRNLTNYPADIPVGEDQSRPYIASEVIYDNAGNVHVFWESLRSTQDIAGTAIESFFDRDYGIQHWSLASGITQAASWSSLPGAAQDPDSILFYAGGPGDQIGANSTLVTQPQAGVDAQGNLYLVFAALRPGDVDSDTAHFTDIYAVGSKDGGKTWGSPVSLTNSPQSEEMWPSLADNVGDSLRFIYQSDDETGNVIFGGGTVPTNVLYYAVDKDIVPLMPSAVDEHPNATMPGAFALHPSFPNPFNPSTQIAFDLAKAVRVKLSVYDVNGKLIATLVNNKLEAGTHSITWNANGQPSGVYFAKLEAEGLSQVQKMTLVK